MTSAPPLVEVSDLRVRLATPRGPADAVRGVSFTLARGETLGLVGESGCGKSLTALALLGLLPDGARASGSVRFDGRELLGLDEAALCRLRGNRIGMVFQEPMTALNPLARVGDQVAEPLRLHRRLSAGAARGEAVALLDRVGLSDAARRAGAYPNQLSGGQRQRVTIAMALACGPDLLIADEPTTALDATVQRQVLDLVADLVAERGMALLLISHDLGVIAEYVQRMLVMYGGTVAESGPTGAVYARRAHPYTQGLFAARPALASDVSGVSSTSGASGVAGMSGGAAAAVPRRRRLRLATIGGSVPELADLPPGCPFAGRCRLTVEACVVTPPPPVEIEPGHVARCLRIDAALATAP
jgi:peptide/nickel transport system ATP-binding protein